ncbi:MAG: FTR1 family protein [Sciscionella sp.]|nr:FTR1 family protein [Sciscionella sp.]
MIGLREGLEGGLVVSILLAALRKTAPGAQVSTAPVWLGVLGAMTVAGSFASVLSFSTSVLSSSAQEAVGGLLSVLAVGLVTAMVFWMRRTAAGLSKHLRGEVSRAAAIGAGALTLTAFLAVGREGLETTLFLWTAVKASGSTVAPIIGAAIGIGAAIVLCWLLFRQAVRLNLGVFFNRTALALIVVAAGVLAYGLGDLQDAGLLPGRSWVAFDLTAHIDPNSWWASIITGVTELAPKMTVLQVVAWLVYLTTVWAFLRMGRAMTPAGKPSKAPETKAKESDGKDVSADNEAEPVAAGRWERLAGNRPWLVAGVLVLVPAAVAGATIAALPPAAASTSVTVTATDCAKDWSAAQPGTQTFTVVNKSNKAGEINLTDSAGAVVGEIETLGPATSAQLTATLSNGSYAFQCHLAGVSPTSSAALTVTGGSSTGGPTPVRPVTVAELTPPNNAYQSYAAGVLRTLTGDVAKIRADLVSANIPAAKRDWLVAQQDWERVGASYDSFGDLGTAVDGLSGGLAGGPNDPGFTGLHRLEYGLWHGQPATRLVPVVDTLAADIAKVRDNLGSDDLAGDPTNLPVRAHEVLEDAQRDHLSGLDDNGAGAAYPMTAADVRVTRTLLSELKPLLDKRSPNLVSTVDTKLDALDSALTRTGMRPPAATPLANREAVNSALGEVLETLDAVPNLLEVPPTH